MKIYLGKTGLDKSWQMMRSLKDLIGILEKITPSGK